MNEIIYLSPAQLARRWSTSKRTLARMREEGVGPVPVKIAGGTFGHLRYNVADVEAYEEQLKQEAKADGIPQSENHQPGANASGEVDGSGE